MLFPGTRPEVTAWHVITVPNPGPAASAPKGSEAVHRSYARWLDFPTLYSYPPSTLTCFSALPNMATSSCFANLKLAQP
jgi:hypothetical protein